MAAPVSRLDGARDAVLRAIATAGDIPIENFGPDEDIVDDLIFDELECESLGLILEEVFGIVVPEELWHSPLYRTAASLAEWCIRQSDLAAEVELQRQRRRA